MISTDPTGTDRDLHSVLTRLQQLQDAPRRTYLTYAGLQSDSGTGEESLLVTAHASDLLTRTEQYLLDTALDVDDIYASPLLSIPLPRYRSTDTGAVFGSPNPAAYWHPLAWLPTPLALPERADEENGADETDDEWAMRVAFELAAAGLYDPHAGWVDILALHGIDTRIPAHLERVRAWISGAGDDVLDRIDLTDLFAGTDTLYGDGWAKERASETFDAYKCASWSVAARTLLDDLNATATHRGLPDQAAVFATAAAAASYLGDATPAGDDPDDDDEQDYADRLVSICTATDPDHRRALTEPELADAAAELTAVLAEIRDAYADAETELDDAEAQALHQIDSLITGKHT